MVITDNVSDHWKGGTVCMSRLIVSGFQTENPRTKNECSFYLFVFVFNSNLIGFTNFLIYLQSKKVTPAFF